MSGKLCVTMSVILAALPGACASQADSVQRGLASAQADARRSAVESERRALTEHALARLDELERETTRVANRLIYEGTAEQRAAWDQDLNDLEHDRKLLAEELREAELAAPDEWAAEHDRLTSMIDVLIISGQDTAAQIDRTLDADRAAARARSVESATTATD